MAKVRIGRVELGGAPRIVAVVNGFVPLRAARGLKKRGAAILEIRADLFPGGFDEVCACVRRLRKETGLPMIGTIRETAANREQRLRMFECLIPLVDAVDIEIDAAVNREVIRRAAGKTVIVSEHDFEKTPDRRGLSRIVARAKKLGADIIKIAVAARSGEDVARLLCFTHSRKENIVAVSMGEAGMLSRIAAPLFGSLFTYAYIAGKTAPGQMELDAAAAAMRAYYPDF